MPDRTRSTLWLPAAVLIGIASAVLAGRSAAHLERLWDEQVDHDIAIGLQAHPVTGEKPALDASQLRLPMYANALAYAVTGRNDLAIGRLVSLIVGALTIIATAYLARILFDSTTAILAAALLGASPYFLSFERIAMTEGDVFFAFGTTVAIIAFVRFLQHPSADRWLAGGLAFAIALGAKFFGIFLIPVFVVLATSTRSRNDWQPPHNPGASRKLLASLVMGTALVFGGPLAMWMLRKTGPSTHESALGRAIWLLVLLSWVRSAFLAQGGNALPRTALGRCLGLLVFGIISCGALFPVHVTEPDIALELLRRTLHWDHRLPLALWSDHLRLYSGIVLLKLSIPLGCITAIALLLAAFRERDDGRWRPCILPIIFYVVLLCFLPLRQTFYLMGVYPLIMIVAAGFIVELSSWSRARGSRIAVRIVIAVTLVHFGWIVSRAYPYFHLHGYRMIGDTWMGRESRGYRNLIQTPSDGVEEMIRWCCSDPSVKPGSRIVSYLWEERIIESLLPKAPRFAFTPRGLSQESDALPPPPAIDHADFVLLHINNLLGYGDRPPDTPPLDQLARDFHIVHAVQRGPLDVAWIYARK